MELQIKDLVDSIKKDGVEKAKAQAEAIIAEAQKKADSIISKATEKAEKIVADAKKETSVLKESAKVSANQAKRDAALSFENEIKEVYKKLLASDLKKSVNAEALVSIIKAAVSDQDVSKLTVELKEVSEALKAQLASEIKKGLEIKVSKSVDSGFRLASKDGSGYFDCSEEELINMITPFFNDLSL